MPWHAVHVDEMEDSTKRIEPLIADNDRMAMI